MIIAMVLFLTGLVLGVGAALWGLKVAVDRVFLR